MHPLSSEHQCKHHPFAKYKLQKISILSAVLGYAILIPYGIVTKKLFPTLGLVPLGVSFVKTIITLRVLFHSKRIFRERRGDYQIVLDEDNERPHPGKTFFGALVDLIIAAGLMTVIVFSLIEMTKGELIWVRSSSQGHYWKVETSPYVWGTYGTVPLWISCFVHMRSFKQAVGKNVRENIRMWMTCPECYAQARQRQADGAPSSSIQGVADHPHPKAAVGVSTTGSQAV